MLNCFRWRTCQRFGLVLMALLLGLSVQALAGEYGTDAELAGAGARALAMGTSFIGLADDATAIEFNPAGLLILERPEFALQVRYTRQKHDEFLPLTSRGGLTPEKTTFRESYFTPSFASVVIPFPRFALGVSELTTINSHTRMKDEGVHPSLGKQSYKWHHNVTAQQYGITAAYMLTPELFAGTTLKMTRLDIYRSRGTGISYRRETDRTTGYGANFGLLYRPVPLFSLGAVYKTKQSVPFTSDLGAAKQRLDLTIPETMGFGIGVFPNDRLRFAMDVDRVKWSQFKDENVNWLERDDVTRFHFGGEYLFALNSEKERAWFARAGYMWEESNSVRANSHAPAMEQRKAPREDPISHYTLGLGVAFRRIQLDVGVDLSTDQEDYILSTVFYF